jgi:uncharacterized membrane protein YheB (UPF0754 family)
LDSVLIHNILFWGIPPVAGAIIGYVTNAVAIKMLFRPLSERRIFGLHVPFTPGILPRERKKLAESIGRMVERELLTPEILRERLFKDDVKAKLSSAIASFTANLAKEPLNRLLPQEVQDKITVSLRTFLAKSYIKATDSIVSFLREPEMHAELELRGRVFLQKTLDKFNGLQRFFVTAAGYDTALQDSMPQIVDDLIFQIKALLETPKVGETLLGRMGGFLSDFAERNGALSIEELFSLKDEKKARLDAFIADKLLDVLDKQLDNLLAIVNVRKLVSDRIDALDMLRVEGIVLDVMAGELKWINVFGAILGGLIGIFQALLSRLLT